MHAAEPIFGVQVGVVPVRTHREDECGGPLLSNGKPGCCIHNPSDHHMRSWPLNWRGDTGVMERLCPHRTGHPDPDHLAFIEFAAGQRVADGQRQHGCRCGCCKPPGPVLSAGDVGKHLNIGRDTVLRYLWESQGEGRRYSDHPFPEPFGRIGKSAYWLAEQLPAITEWHRLRKGQGVGGGPKKKT
jgi:hypothetical protein